MPLEQALPSATQSFAEPSQHPDAQLLPGQQACPGPPHTVQVFCEQTVLAPVQVELEQQG